jgi:hypothetical protein
MLKKLVITTALLVGITGSAFAYSNGWYSNSTVVTQVFVIDTDVGEVCQFTLGDGTNWAFKVPGREKIVDLVQAALINAKGIKVNYRAGDTTALSWDYVDFTPVFGTAQHVPQAHGVSLTR